MCGAIKHNMYILSIVRDRTTPTGVRNVPPGLKWSVCTPLLFPTSPAPHTGKGPGGVGCAVRAIPYPTTAPETATSPTLPCGTLAGVQLLRRPAGGRVPRVPMLVSGWYRSHLRARSKGNQVIIGKEENLKVLPPIPSLGYKISPPSPMVFSRVRSRLVAR